MNDIYDRWNTYWICLVNKFKKKMEPSPLGQWTKNPITVTMITGKHGDEWMKYQRNNSQ